MNVQKSWAWLAGILLLAVGIWGFVEGNSVFVIFEVNEIHNVVHIASAAIFIWGAWKGSAKFTNQWLGPLYIVIGMAGFFGILDFMAVNLADNWAHIAIGFISSFIGWAVK